jgi:hypothetical protein
MIVTPTADQHEPSSSSHAVSLKNQLEAAQRPLTQNWLEGPRTIACAPKSVVNRRTIIRYCRLTPFHGWFDGLLSITVAHQCPFFRPLCVPASPPSAQRHLDAGHRPRQADGDGRIPIGELDQNRSRRD